ncbi:F-box/WD repeat-containing protein 9-like [Diprion similis]|uniref:F-box/WD repeat-containing protein 9-like n=1 Tax=Diprion similis TaxID=362088 RepID=UPI001EF81207|nr:F-box/WD repeat-containing protein 9-like [Diprion similis]
MCDTEVSPQNTTSSLSLLDLPVEILLHICSFLDAATLVHSLSLVCKEFNLILNDDSMWKARISQIWPHCGYPILPSDDDNGLFWKLSCSAIERQNLLWGKEQGETMEKLSLHNIHYSTIDSILLVNKGNVCVSGARDRSLVYSVLPNKGGENPVSKTTNNAHDGWIWDLTALDDNIYSCSWDRTVKSWKLSDTGLIPLNTYEMKVTAPLLCVTSSPHLGLFACGSYCKTVLVFDPRSRSQVATYQPHQRAIVRLTMNSNYILTASEDKTLSIWDHRSRKTVKTIKISNENFPMSISMQKSTVYAGDNGGKLHVLDLNNDLELVKSYETGHKKGITGVYQAPGLLITTSLDKSVRISSPTNPPKLLTSLNSTYGEIAGMDYLNEVLAISGTDGIQIWRPKCRA